VRTPDFSFLHDDPPQVRSQEMAMATSLIDSLSEPVFEADKYTDRYREALEELIETKVAGGESTTKPGKDEDTGEVVDLMDALKASVNAARKNRPASKKAADKAEDKDADQAEEPEAKPAKKTTARRSRKSA
jgi:DNA end-binding protein Ku